jgi:hypothetical protein
LPPDIQGHFSPTLKSFILYQYYHCHVKQPLLLEQLQQWSFEISAGQLSAILIRDKPGEEILEKVGKQIRDFYDELKDYKAAPSQKKKERLEATRTHMLPP